MNALVFAYPGNEALAKALVAHGLQEGAFEVRQFPDGETFVRIDSDVKGRDAAVLCSLDRPNGKALPLYFLARTLRDLGARRVWLVAPYLAYMRQDTRFHAGEGVTAKQFGAWLSSFIDGIVTVDPHLHRLHNLNEIYAIPARIVAAASSIAAWIAQHVKSPLLVGPDCESEQWVCEVARVAGCPYIVLEKKRLSETVVAISLPPLAPYADRVPVLIDDIISTGHTMIEATRQLARAGAPPPICVGVHAIFAGDAHEEMIRAGVARIATCNTIEHPTNAIDVYPLVAQELNQEL